jgi:hypothetical protein
MRIFEIASAEEQLALWKLISDSVWTTISQQARTEAQQRAAAAAKSRQKPKKPKKLKKPPRAPAPPKPQPQNKSAVPARPQTASQPARTQPRPSPLPTRQPPLPSSQPVLPAVRSSTFSQGDLNRIQTSMTSPSGFNTGTGIPV